MESASIESLSLESLKTYPLRLEAWLEPIVDKIVSADHVIQLALGVAIMLASLLLSRRVEIPTNSHIAGWFPADRQRMMREGLQGVIFPFIWLLMQSFIVMLGNRIGIPTGMLEKISVLLLAWIIIRLSTGLVSSRSWAKLITSIAWAFAALSILDLLEPTVFYLDNLAFSLGKWDISVLGVIKGVIMVTFMLWAAMAMSRTIERRVRKSTTLTPSMQELINKLLRFTFLVSAFFISLTSVGVDLTAFAVFGGALGVGIGFGLQRIVANLLGGIILLMDRSIKPGDVIELENSYGWVNALGARFVSVITRDGKEHLIPNEDLITQKVINWSFSDTNVRIKVPVRIAYSSDVNLAMNLLLEAANETARVLESPAPRCLLLEFDENAIILELRIWASDPHNGVANLRGAVLLKVWNKFREHGIRFPYPQRDIHLDMNTKTIETFAKHFGKGVSDEDEEGVVLPRKTPSPKPKTPKPRRRAAPKPPSEI